MGSMPENNANSSDERPKESVEAYAVELTVGEAARYLGVSVRTLHHWDKVGLLCPRWRTMADHRLYEEADLARGQHILIYREAGMPLAEIAKVLDEAVTIRQQRAHLIRQKHLLEQQQHKLNRMLSAVDELLALSARKDNQDMSTDKQTDADKKLSTDEIKDILGDNWDPAYQDEAEQRWGNTEAWQQSQQKQQSMGKEDWQQVKEEQDRLVEALAQARAGGVEPGSEEGNAIAERHRATVAQWYDCPHARQVILARMYTQDERFAQTYRGHADYLLQLVEKNAQQHGVDLNNLASD